MAVIVRTENPRELLAAIKKSIDDNDIVTWDYDIDGDFSHTAEQWRRQAWFRPRVDVGNDRIVFNMISPRGKPVTRAAYAVYHGRFIEMLLAHFDRKFTNAFATAMPTSEDRVKPVNSM
jgi:hypothetical protein